MKMQITAAEMNLICFLRTRKPHEVVMIRYNGEAVAPYYSIMSECKMVIDNGGIRELPVRERELSTA
jgi:hypothetical protein